MTKKPNFVEDTRVGGCSRREFLAGATRRGTDHRSARNWSAGAGQLQNQAGPDRLRRPGQLDRRPLRNSTAATNSWPRPITSPIARHAAARGLSVPADKALQRPFRLQAADGRQARRHRHREPAIFSSRAGRRGRRRRLPRLLRQADRRGRARLPDHRRGRPQGHARRSAACWSISRPAPTSSTSEAVRRVHAGDIGPLVSGEAVYYCRRALAQRVRGRDDPTTPRTGSAPGVLDRVLSGDIITEQNIHALDVATWIVDQEPLQGLRHVQPAKAAATGHLQRQLRRRLHLPRRGDGELRLEAIRHRLR